MGEKTFEAIPGGKLQHPEPQAHPTPQTGSRTPPGLTSTALRRLPPPRLGALEGRTPASNRARMQMLSSRSAGATQGEAVQVPSSGGSRLSDGVRAKMEGALGADFSGVRVHHGDTAARLGAAAFAQGEHVHFAPGAYSEQTLGHELAHVIQQRQGRVPITGEVGGVALNDSPALEAEADRMADAAMAWFAPPRHREGTSRMQLKAVSINDPLPGPVSRGRPEQAPGRTAPMIQHKSPTAPVQRATPEHTEGVIQRHHHSKGGREKFEQKMDFILMPDPEMVSYKIHVKHRTTFFFVTLLRGVLFTQEVGAPVSTGLFSNTAEAQAGQGGRWGKGEPDAEARRQKSVDAAHLMRNSFNPPGGLSASQEEEAKELRLNSAATTPQFQASNVGSDKVIDKVQTHFKNLMLSELASGATITKAFIQKHLKAYIKTSYEALHEKAAEKYKGGTGAGEGIKGESYDVAISALEEQAGSIDSLLGDICGDLGIK